MIPCLSGEGVFSGKLSPSVGIPISGMVEYGAVRGSDYPFLGAGR
jgi:hypothetical protein